MRAKHLAFTICLLLFYSYPHLSLRAQEVASQNTFHPVPIDGTQLRKIRSDIVGQEYLLKIRLPDKYHESKKTYPVLYLLDGDHAFAMTTDIVEYLSYGRHVPDLIIVSPAYGSKHAPASGGTNMRSRDLNYAIPGAPKNAGGEKYFRFIKEELIPYVDKNFKTDPSDRALAGYSAGARFALITLFREPSLFRRYVIVDGFSSIVMEMEKAHSEKHRDLSIHLFLSSSIPEADLYRFSETLKNRKYQGLELKYADLSDVSHFAVGAEGLTRGLKAVYDKISIFDLMLKTIRSSGIKAALSQYKDLKTSKPAEFNFTEAELTALGSALIRMDRMNDAIQVFKLNVEEYPKSSGGYELLADAYRRKGEKELAIANYKKALELNPKNERAAEMLKNLEGQQK